MCFFTYLVYFIDKAEVNIEHFKNTCKHLNVFQRYRIDWITNCSMSFPPDPQEKPSYYWNILNTVCIFWLLNLRMPYVFKSNG